MRRLVFFAVMLAVPLCVLEILSYFVTAHNTELYFSYEDAYFREVNKKEFDRFVQSPYFDASLGWNNPVQPTRASRKNCVGDTIEYNYRDGRRVTPGLVEGRALVALFGESYTQGEEVGDSSTIASVLTNTYGIPTVNFGVNAYDPLQAAMKLKTALPQTSTVRVAVLLVMHENVWRIVNSFKPVYYPYKTDFYFGLKPYVEHGSIVPLRYPTEYQDFLREARKRFSADYWAKPARRFPYSISLIRAAGSHSVISRMWAKYKGQFVYEYQRNDELRSDMARVLDEFVTASRAAAVRPVIVFVPRSVRSYRSSEPFVRDMNRKWGSEVAHEFVDKDLDWARYRLSAAADYCHPSPYGYARIAAFLRNILVNELRRPTS